MELKEFIKETLKDIVSGVKEAQKSVSGLGGTVAPRTTNGDYKNDGGTEYRVVRNVEFEIGLTIEDSGERKGKIGVLSGVFSIGAGVSETSGVKSFNSVRFSIPVAFPVD